ncbi:caspase family protein, partial [Streptomyces sp. NPDC006553]|uniref:nSTAND1 domain-containing NTPase n=1 Tax=Streptomyces sp. NPDC006553 TaxID=3157180 RepID=UPI0033ACA622
MTEAGEPKRYVLAFGAAQYAHDELPALPRVADDLPRVLGSLAGLGYEPVPVFPSDGSLDPPDPQDVLRPLLRWIPEGFEDDDALLVYYSGHGQADGQEHFLMCTESDPGSAEVRITAVSTRQLVELPARKGVRRILLVIDACYAGRGAVDAFTWAVEAKHAVAHAPNTDHRFLKSFGVLSAARITEEAQDGAFSAALAHVLGDEGWLGHRSSHISLSDLTGALNAEFRRRGVDHHADWAQLCDDTVRGDTTTGFFRNPFHVPELDLVDRDLDVAEQRHFVRRLEAASGYGAAERQRRYKDLVEHFSPRGTGRQAVQETGHYFTGRVRVLTRLAGWLRGGNDQEARVFVVTGPPGVGKSAVLGRLVALADDDARGVVPAATITPGTAPPSGSVTVALHARALSLPQVVSALAAALGCPEPTETALRARLTELGHIATVVVDALDESGVAHDEEHRIARFLADLAASAPRLRLLVGTRPHLAGAVADGAPYSQVVDLASPDWTEPDDLVRYAASILRSPLGPHSGTGVSDALVEAAAAEIARASDPIYLVARLMARSVAGSGLLRARAPLALPARDPAAGPAAQVGRAFRWALAQHLTPAEVAEVGALLLPLAYAEGHGMPLAPIWAALAADRPRQVGPTAERLTRLLRDEAVGPYLVEALDEDDRSVYRLYHKALADELRRHDAPPDAEKRWYVRLRDTVPRTADGTVLWHAADPYVLRHLPAKAAAADRLDELVTDGEFLVHAHPAGLAPWLHGLRTEQARSAAAVYRAHLDLHQDMTREERRHVLACDAARHRHTDLLDDLNSGGRVGRWRPHWAAAGSAPTTLSVQRLADGRGPVESAAFVGTTGRDSVVVLGGGTPQAWDLATGRASDLVSAATERQVTALTATTSAGHDLLVTGTETGALHFHDLTTGKTGTAEPVEEGSVRGAIPAGAENARADALVPLELNERKAVVSASADGELRAWDVADTRPLPWRVRLPDGRTGGLAAVTVDAVPQGMNHPPQRGRDVVVAGGPQGVLYVWDPTRGKLTATPADPDRPALDSVDCALLHTLPVAVTADRAAVRIWSLRRPRAPREVGTLPLRSPAVAVSCTTLSGRPTAVLACEDGTVHLLDLESRRLTASSAAQPSPAQGASPSPAEVVPPSPGPAPAQPFTTLHTHASADGAVTAVLGASDGSVHVCDVTAPPAAPSAGHTRPVTAAACVGGKDRPRYLVTASTDTTVRIWRMDTGATALPPLTDTVSAFTGVVAACVDDRLLALTRAANRPAEVWDLSSGMTMDRQSPRWPVAETVGRYGGRPVAVTAGHTHHVDVWDLVSGVSLRRLEQGPGPTPVTALACAPGDGALAVVAARANGSVMMWRDDTRRSPHALQKGWEAVAVACVRAEGRPVALIACDDAVIRAWDGTDTVTVARWEPRPDGAESSAATLPGRWANRVTALSARVVDGRLLCAVGDGGGRVTVWETYTGAWPLPACGDPADSFTMPGGVPVTALEFAVDGRLVICAETDVHVFGTSPAPEPADGPPAPRRRPAPPAPAPA